MAKGKTDSSRTRAQSAAQATTAEERKKKAVTGGEKKREPSKTMGKWFPSVTHDEDLEMLAVEKSLAATLRWRLPKDEAMPTPTSGERVLH